MSSHDVYWGSHGCHKNWPHAGACRCGCGEYLTNMWNVYGDDAAEAITFEQRREMKRAASPNEAP